MMMIQATSPMTKMARMMAILFQGEVERALRTHPKLSRPREARNANGIPTTHSAPFRIFYATTSARREKGKWRKRKSGLREVTLIASSSVSLMYRFRLYSSSEAFFPPKKYAHPIKEREPARMVKRGLATLTRTGSLTGSESHLRRYFALCSLDSVEAATYLTLVRSRGAGSPGL